MNLRSAMVMAMTATLLTPATRVLAHGDQDKDDDAKRDRRERVERVDGAGHGWLGVRLQRVDGGLAEALDLKEDSGVLIGQVVDDSPAAAGGLQSGDILLKIGNDEVGTPDDVRRIVRGLEPGDKVSVKVRRDGRDKTMDVALGEEPEPRRTLAGLRDRLGDGAKELRFQRQHGFLGVTTQPVEGDLAEYFGAKDGGVLVAEVVEDSPAAKLGLKAGDVIVSVDGEAVEDPGDLRRIVGDHEEAAEVEVAWIRDHKPAKGKVTLEVRDGMQFFGMGPGDEPFFRWHGDGPHAFFDGDDMENLRRDVGDHRVRIERFVDGDEMKELRKQIEELRQEIEKLKSD